MISNSESLERPEDAGRPPSGPVARWIMELRLADKADSNWREQAKTAYKRYAGNSGNSAAKRQSGFNILWSNTETLAPAIYNSLPRPDVRRRFSDSDPVGKYVSDVLERSISFGLDDEDFDSKIKPIVLDLLLGGRAVARVRYIPSFVQVDVDGAEHEESEEIQDGHEAQEGAQEELAWEQVPIEHVHWEDYRQGPGRSWQEVCWVAFKHRLTREECVEKFQDIGNDIPLENVDIGDENKIDRDGNLDTTVWKRATVWEIWDKDSRKVLWLCSAYPDRLLREDEDPLNLVNFFPIPRPLLSIERPDCLEPVTLFSQYESQAKELDTLTYRIQKIIGAIKARGIYDSMLGNDLANLFKGDDNELIPSESAVALTERGGLDKFIWMNPVEKLVLVVRELIAQREQLKQTVYEISGISDIMRGSSMASETATAQQIKGQWGSMRVSRMQRDFQRFVRDLIRIKCELIAEKFSPQTLQTMTDIQLPSMQVKMLSQQAGQQVNVPAWEEIIETMRDDSLRSFRIDVETDSTIQQELSENQQAFAQGIQAITGFMSAVAPAVQSGAFPIDAAKAIIMAWARRSRLGREVEDALEQIKAPNPPPQAQDNSAQVEQMKAQQAMQMKQVEMQHDAQMESGRMQHEMSMAQAQAAQDSAKFQTELEIKKIESDIKRTELELKQIELMLKEKEINQNAAIESKRIDMSQIEKETETETE